jgi:rhodanese-related sulfurtransferase
MANPPKPGFTEISPKQLMRLIGTPDCPVILDVCVPDDVAENPFRIPTSRSMTHTDIETMKQTLMGQNVVVVCQKGKKLSHGVAALLRASRIKAEVLAGGILAWLATDLPRTPIAALPATDRWVTRHRPKIDRIACPWLIRCFVDPNATFMFVPPADVALVADKFNAIPFDVPDVTFTHQAGRCTFDAMLDHFGLDTPTLRKMADIIRAADTDDTSIPEAAGLLAMSVGRSRLYKDDNAQLTAALPLYDALYRWARDGQDETHDWPYGQPSGDGQ